MKRNQKHHTIKAYILLCNIILAVISFSSIASVSAQGSDIGKQIPGLVQAGTQALSALQQSTQETPTNTPVPSGNANPPGGYNLNDWPPKEGQIKLKDGSYIDVNQINALTGQIQERNPTQAREPADIPPTLNPPTNPTQPTSPGQPTNPGQLNHPPFPTEPGGLARMSEYLNSIDPTALQRLSPHARNVLQNTFYDTQETGVAPPGMMSMGAYIRENLPPGHFERLPPLNQHRLDNTYATPELLRTTNPDAAFKETDSIMNPQPGITQGQVPQTVYDPNALSIAPQGAYDPNTPSIPAVDNVQNAVRGYFQGNFLQSLVAAGAVGGAGAFVGSLAGGINGELYGFISGFAGAITYQLAKRAQLSGGKAALLGLGVAAGIFLLTYKKAEEEKVDFHCFPYQPPLGGRDCELCNEQEECSEYTCRSLGQACEIVNDNTNATCIWKNPHDTNSPIIKFLEVNKGHTFSPDTTRPTGTGVEIRQEDGSCLKAFTPLEFTFTTRDRRSQIGEPSQCKIDFNLTTTTAEDTRAAFENMQFFVGGEESFKYNHTETLSLPGPDNINQEAPELQNDGTYTLFIRCQDANGNFNQDAYTVKFCVDPGPDTTPPLIVDVNVPSGNAIQFNQTNLDLEVYVNEPSECKWSREDRRFDLMEQDMDCDTQLFQINNENSYTCRTTLTGIEDRQDNTYYFRCKDQPSAEEADRNVNKQSYQYTITGTQPLTILSVGPEEGITISGSTDTVPVTLTIETDNGHNNGEAICYYGTTGEEEDFLQFRDSNTTNIHEQRQDLLPGEYTYFYKCVDFAGNAVYNQTSFTVETDRQPPTVARSYYEGSQLKIVTTERAECSYSTIDCNFEIDDGLAFSSLDSKNHHIDWRAGQTHYIRCKDQYDNQPDPNTCSIIVRPTEISSRLPPLLL